MKADLNPLWDPLFDEHSLYAPELTLLAGSEAAYARDVARARKSIVHLPYAREFSSYYACMKDRELLSEDGNLNKDQVSFASPCTTAIEPEEAPARTG